MPPEGMSQIDFKRLQVIQNKEIIDWERLKYMTFQAIKADLVKEFRISETVRNRNLNIMHKWARMSVVHLTLVKCLCQLWSNYMSIYQKKKDEMRLKFYVNKAKYIRRVRINRFAPTFDLHLVNNIRQRLTFFANCGAQEKAEDVMKGTLRLFLYDKMKIDQLKIKMANYAMRIINIQTRGKKFVQVKLKYQQQLLSKIENAMHSLQLYLVSNMKKLRNTKCKEK